MNTAAKQKAVDLVDVFRERCEARALLWHLGEIDLHEAVDVLQADAQRDGLIRRFGQDFIQELLSRAFKYWEAQP